MKPHKTVFHWSGGKDCSIALNRLLNEFNFRIDTLLTTMNRDRNRVSMHGVRRELIEMQAKQIDIPLSTLDLPDQPGMQEYNQLMKEKMQSFQQQGYSHAAFGDIFLEDLKLFREKQMEEAEIIPVFPIWQMNTMELIRQFIEDGFKAVIVCAKADKLDASFAGRLIDDRFLDELPDDVDPCGENGEFHTFVYDGPVFSEPVRFKKGEVLYREYNSPKEDDDQCGLSDESDPQKMGFWFCDLLPTSD